MTSRRPKSDAREEGMPGAGRSEGRSRARYRLASRLFAGDTVSESVVTRVAFEAIPEVVWERILFYEEVPGPPSFLLGALLPRPLRTEGKKGEVGATVLCEYSGGDLSKRITTVQAPRRLEFEVVEQHLGIESCVRALGGSYELHGSATGTDVLLTTRYDAYLRPRFLWRPLETLLVGELHEHILRGMSAMISSRDPSRPAEERCSPPPGVLPGALT
jgi:hypothetical protein